MFSNNILQNSVIQSYIDSLEFPAYNSAWGDMGGFDSSGWSTPATDFVRREANTTTTSNTSEQKVSYYINKEKQSWEGPLEVI